LPETPKFSLLPLPAHPAHHPEIGLGNSRDRAEKMKTLLRKMWKGDDLCVLTLDILGPPDTITFTRPFTR
jgi:vesicle coat complex subunit